MKPSDKEPQYLFTNDDVAQKSPLAAAFLQNRTRLNDVVTKADNPFVKRFYNLDHNAYLEGGALPAKTKELMGLSVSAALRCDDCIIYHVVQAYRLGALRREQEETLDVALLIGGSIVIPHMRRAYALLDELYT
jgi:ribonuclease HI